MKAITDEHPSLVPVGLGNNNSVYDVSLLASSVNTSDFDFSDGLGLETKCIGDNVDGSNGNSEGEGGNSDGEEDVPAKVSSSKVAKCKADLVELWKPRKHLCEVGNQLLQ